MKHILKTSLAAALLIVAGCTGDDEANAAPADDSSSDSSSSDSSSSDDSSSDDSSSDDSSSDSSSSDSSSSDDSSSDDSSSDDSSSDSSSEASSETTNDAVADASTPALFMGNATCPNSGMAVDEELFVESDGQKAYFCSAKCQAEAAKDPAAAILAAYPAATPLGNATCPISGDPVEDGESITWQGQEVGLCCGMCVKGFKKDPTASIAKALAE